MQKYCETLIRMSKQKKKKILVDSPVVGKTEELLPISSRPEKMIHFMTIMTHFKTSPKPDDSMAVSLSAYRLTVKT